MILQTWFYINENKKKQRIMLSENRLTFFILFTLILYSCFYCVNVYINGFLIT